MLKGKKVLLGITGGIAAYKSAELVRLFIKQGAEVKVILTRNAHSFVTPLTLATLSKNPVYSDFFKTETGEWSNHVELALWADVFVIAPLTANTLGKMAGGICDNFLMACYLSAKCPVWVAPAMDLDMYKHSTTVNNLEKIASFGNSIIPAASGELASGLSGEGRMQEPLQIFQLIESYFDSKDAVYKGKKVLITAGPTYEAIDPVRFIGNHSSGKMGFAIAEELSNRGAEVTLVSGPVSLKPSSSIHYIQVQSAMEMEAACNKVFQQMDAAILAAAVADYRPKEVNQQKIKKVGETLTIELVKNPDILAGLGKTKKAHQVLVGFALETQNELEYAKEKLVKKNLDFIVLNSLNTTGAGFKGDTNKIVIIDKDNNVSDFGLKTKGEVASDIVNYLGQKWSK